MIQQTKCAKFARITVNQGCEVIIRELVSFYLYSTVVQHFGAKKKLDTRYKKAKLYAFELS